MQVESPALDIPDSRPNPEYPGNGVSHGRREMLADIHLGRAVRALESVLEPGSVEERGAWDAHL